MADGFRSKETHERERRARFPALSDCLVLAAGPDGGGGVSRLRETSSEHHAGIVDGAIAGEGRADHCVLHAPAVREAQPGADAGSAAGDLHRAADDLLLTRQPPAARNEAELSMTALRCIFLSALASPLFAQ